jgi:hypothetical protein
MKRERLIFACLAATMLASLTGCTKVVTHRLEQHVVPDAGSDAGGGAGRDARVDASTPHDAGEHLDASDPDGGA